MCWTAMYKAMDREKSKYILKRCLFHAFFDLPKTLSVKKDAFQIKVDSKQHLKD